MAMENRDERKGETFIVLFLLLTVGSTIYYAMNKQRIGERLFRIAAAEVMFIEKVAYTDNWKARARSIRSALVRLEPVPVKPPGLLLSMIGEMGAFWLPLTAPFMAWLSIALWRRSVPHQFKRLLSFEDLLKLNSIIYPRMKPVLDRDPRNEDPQGKSVTWVGGDLRWADDYRSFATLNKVLLDEEKKPIPVTEMRPSAAGVDHSAAENAFILQLGMRFTGPKSLSVYEKGLFAAFAARINTDRDAADALFDRMSATYRPASGRRPAQISTRGADALIARYARSEEVMEVIARHFHTRCVLVAMLTAAIERSGVVERSNFIWLRPTDRTLWYALNQVGRRVAFPEAAGIRAHMLAEEAEGKPRATPATKAAVRALIQELSNEGHISESSPAYVPPQTMI